MLGEETLIVVAAFVACAFLVLGVLELLWPTQTQRRRPVPPRAARPHRQSARVRHTRDRGRPPYVRRQPPLTPSPVPLAPLAASVLPIAATPFETENPEAATEHGALEPVAHDPTTLAADVRSAATATDESIVELCFALYQEQRFADVVARGTPALAGEGPPLADPQETAALWSVMALAHQARGEDTQSRTALENAIATAPAADRPTYQRQLASLAQTVARGLIAAAQRHTGGDSEDGLGMLRSAVAWLDRGAEAAPDDRTLTELGESAQARLWPLWERTVIALAQRQDFRAARRLLREALADPRFPAARAETFKELFSGTFSGEIGQLTAQAIRSMQEARESDALASLQRAETLLDTLNDEALPASRRDEVDRRLWWGYNKLGARRIEAGFYDGALEPLFHALGYDVGPARRQETVALLVRALDGVADTRALAVRELADAGDGEAALVQCDKLWALLRSATDMGLTQEDVAAVFGKAQRLFDALGRSRR